MSNVLIPDKSKLDCEIEFIETYKKYSNTHPFIRKIECQKVAILNNLVLPKKEENTVGSTTIPYRSFSGFSESDEGGYYLKIFDIEYQYNNYSLEDREKIDQIKKFWSGKTTMDKLEDSFDPVQRLIKKAGIGDAAIRVGGAIPNFERLLKEGLNGYRDRINSKIKNEDKLSFYNALLKTCDLIEDVSRTYSKKIALMAENEQNIKEKDRLIKLSNICRKVPCKPAESFQEALQAIWFIMITGRFYNLGRFDQYMYPYYKNDIKKGDVTKEEAYDLLKEFWTKFHLLGSGMYQYERGKVGPRLAGIGKIILAGKTPSGESGVNELTYLCLEVTRELKFENPSIVVRWFDGIPEKIMDLSFEMLKEGASNPVFFNDNVGIKIMEKMGIPLEDARNYILSDCGEISVGGKSYAGADSSGHPS